MMQIIATMTAASKLRYTSGFDLPARSMPGSEISISVSPRIFVSESSETWVPESSEKRRYLNRTHLLKENHDPSGNAGIRPAQEAAEKAAPIKNPCPLGAAPGVFRAVAPRLAAVRAGSGMKERHFGAVLAGYPKSRLRGQPDIREARCQAGARPASIRSSRARTAGEPHKAR
jgi:hypothetical protein